MRISATVRDEGTLYRLVPEADDPASGESFLPRGQSLFRLVKHEFLVAGLNALEVHPDLHAAALYLILHPVVGARLELPVPVSQAFARTLEEWFGVDVVPVDPLVTPRESPSEERPLLMLSGGMDSTAAALILPQDTPLVFHDRIPPRLPGQAPGTLIHLVQQRRLRQAFERNGHTVFHHRDTHEQLFQPYPSPNTNMTLVAPLLRADRLGVGVLEYGAVMADRYFEGYTLGEVASWRFRRDPGAEGEGTPRPKQRFRTKSGKVFEDAIVHLLQSVALRTVSSSAGMSEVATTLAVHRSPYKGMTYSCHQNSLHMACLKCDKCFRKLLLQHIFDGIDVPGALVEHFLKQPELSGFLKRRFLDFHHVWTYVFQRVRSTHATLRELQRWAQRAPDVGMLERWYVPHERLEVPGDYRRVVAERVRQYLEPMSANDIQALQQLELLELDASVWERGGGDER